MNDPCTVMRSETAHPDGVVFVSCAGSADLHVLRFPVRPGDALSPIQRVELGGAPMPMYLDARRRRLYVADRQPPYAIHFLRILEDGRVETAGTTPGVGNMAYISATNDARWLLAASYGEHRVAAAALAADGCISDAWHVRPTAQNAHAIVEGPQRDIWVPCLGSDVLLCFAEDVRGPIASEPSVYAVAPPGRGPRHLVFGPTGDSLFLIHEVSGTIHLWRRDSTDAWRERAVASVMPGDAVGAPWASELRLSQDGQWLFASERRSGTLSVIRVENHLDRLDLVDRIPCGPVPRGFAITPDGRQVFVASQTEGTLASVAFDPDNGHLTRGETTAVGRNPTWVEVYVVK